MKLFPSLNLEGYPNRNSLVYESVYGIEGAETILRGTLRYKGFCCVMRAMQSVGLFAETPVPESSGGWGACLSTILDASGVEARDALEAFLNEVRLVGSTDDVSYVHSLSFYTDYSFYLFS